MDPRCTIFQQYLGNLRFLEGSLRNSFRLKKKIYSLSLDERTWLQNTTTSWCRSVENRVFASLNRESWTSLYSCWKVLKSNIASWMKRGFGVVSNSWKIEQRKWKHGSHRVFSLKVIFEGRFKGRRFAFFLLPRARSGRGEWTDQSRVLRGRLPSECGLEVAAIGLFFCCHVLFAVGSLVSCYGRRGGFTVFLFHAPPMNICSQNDSEEKTRAGWTRLGCGSIGPSIGSGKSDGSGPPDGGLFFFFVCLFVFFLLHHFTDRIVAVPSRFRDVFRGWRKKPTTWDCFFFFAPLQTSNVFRWFYRVLLGFTGFLLGFISFFMILYDFTGFYWVLSSFYWVFICFSWFWLDYIRFYWVLPSFIRLHWVLSVLTGLMGLDGVLLGFTEFLLGFY